MTITQTCFNQASLVKLFGLFVSIASIEEPTDDFTRVTSDLRARMDHISQISNFSNFSFYLKYLY